MYAPSDFRTTLLSAIANATQRIYLVALYLEHDDAGREILNALYPSQAASARAGNLRTGRLAPRTARANRAPPPANTNADWYCAMASQHPEQSVPIYGVPVNTREALGVLHLKGFVVDDTVIYSGASINDVYLHQHEKYRYDRYQLITNEVLADTLIRLHQAASAHRRRRTTPRSQRSAEKPGDQKTRPVCSVSPCAARVTTSAARPATMSWR